MGKSKTFAVKENRSICSVPTNTMDVINTDDENESDPVHVSISTAGPSK